eukprot:TRINITY_DN327_c0_g1_i11.p2 TRINITY_DN327_c0_g1~~TRINITY_DN327_c0_g1_i11.p2  ORF type:complete len:184 (-),score=34.05 TRINITY_DN327_c0_g1_i11:244-795(-)
MSALAADTVVTTRGTPKTRLANCSAKDPVPPAPLDTRSDGSALVGPSPTSSASRRKHWRTVREASGVAAASTNDTPSGMAARRASGAATCSASAPPPMHPKTRVPTGKAGDGDDVAVTTPATSSPGMSGASADGPERKGDSAPRDGFKVDGVEGRRVHADDDGGGGGGSRVPRRAAWGGGRQR